MEKRENPVSMKYRFNAIHNSYSVFGTEHFKKFSVESSKVTLCTQMYKWEPANLTLGVTLQWTSITSRGRAEYSQTLHATEKGVNSGLMGPLQTFTFCFLY